MAAPLRQGEEHLVHHALDLGINYFDTAEGYGNGRSETVIGKALKGVRRDQYYLATKIGARSDESAASMMSRLDACLDRLQTDYVDVFFTWAVNDIERLRNPEWHEFAAKAKDQGKVRFTGMSGHAGKLIECTEYAVEQDMFEIGRAHV